MVIISTGRRGAQVAQSVKRLPSGQVMIPGSWDWDQASSQAPCSAESPLLPLPLLPFPYGFVLPHRGRPLSLESGVWLVEKNCCSWKQGGVGNTVN